MQKKIKNNLRIGLGMSLLVLLLSSSASYISIQNLIKSAKMVTRSNQIISNLDDIISTLKDAETGQRGYLLSGEEIFLQPYAGSKEKTLSILRQVQRQTTDNLVLQKNADRLQKIIEGRLNIIEETIARKREGKNVSTSELLEGKTYMDNARNLVIAMKANENALLVRRTSDLNSFSGYAPFFIVIALFLSVVITYFFYRKVSSDFSKRLLLEEELRHKSQETDNRILLIKDIAYEISKGNYDVRLDEAQKDGLGSLSGYLNSMAKSLQYSFKMLEDKEWLQSGLASLNDKMVGEKTIANLTSDILESIVEHTKSQVAAFYLIEEDLLHFRSGYALHLAQRNEKIRLGEGIAGQAAVSGQLILVEDVPDDSLTISYALGEVKPKNIIAVPVFSNHHIMGIMEFGSIYSYTTLHLDYFKSVASNIGIAIHTAQNRKKLQEFLEETQAQSEELQAQHSELEGLNSELEAQTQKLQTSEEELRVQQEELLQSNQELEERASLLEEKNQIIQDRNLDILQKAAQIEQSTKYKSEFLANMSHELRTPLNSILLLSKLMSDNKELDEEYVEYAEVIQSSGQGLLSLIDEILDLSKIEAGKMTLEFADVNLNEVSTDMKALFSPIANSKKLSLEIVVSPDLVKVETDKMRLEQILKNLLSNAIKFTSNGKVVLTISKDDSGKLVLFKVTDTGIGIPSDKQSLVFEAFQQADGSTRRKFGGTGLGLSICRELAKLLGGEIKLTSKEDVGSEFTFILPLVRVSADEDSLQMSNTDVKSSEQPLPVIALPERFTVDRIPADVEDDRDLIQPGDKVILIVEDDIAFAKTLLDFTRKRGYRGIVAVRGDVGIELANRFKPLAILLDIQLPVKDGWQVMEELKANPATKPIPVHIMSSLEVKKESLQKGAVDFINKPFALEKMQDIFVKLEEALSRYPKKVLIVEENKQHAEALSYFLSNYNIQTEVAGNITQGIDALQRKEVDIVILDMGIPDKGAYDTLETVKKIKGLENLPIIIFTGKNLSKGEENRIKQYADTIVVKTAHSYQRILDEAGLFLHLVEEKRGDPKSNNINSERIGGLYEVLNNKTVLIADDDVRNIFSITKALEKHKMKVLAATDGKEALQLLIENPKVDIVLMDMMMPEMDGYESTREIRKISAFKQLPILAVTAKAMMGDREKCIAAGASDYISKPVDMDQLISLLRVWLYDKN
jgi:signal transduction histidine kinase/DNA-binding response OmpR family regulator/CHASE3 domain sensor protein